MLLTSLEKRVKICILLIYCLYLRRYRPYYSCFIDIRYLHNFLQFLKVLHFSVWHSPISLAYKQQQWQLIMICNLSQSAPCTRHGSEDTDINGQRESGTDRWHSARALMGTKFNFQIQVELNPSYAGRGRTEAGLACRSQTSSSCSTSSSTGSEGAGWQFAIKLADWRFKVRAVQPSQGLSESPRVASLPWSACVPPYRNLPSTHTIKS